MSYKGDAGGWEPEVSYEGSGEALAEDLADMVAGGQVVLSEAAWRAVQDAIPGQAQARASLCMPLAAGVAWCNPQQHTAHCTAIFT